MKALLWMLVGGGLVLIWFSAPGKKFVDDLKVKATNMSLNAHNYDAAVEKIQNLIKEKGNK